MAPRHTLPGNVLLKLLGKVFAISSGGLANSESTMIPIAHVGPHAMLFLDGSRFNRLDRSDFVLGWCVQQAKAETPAEKPAEKPAQDNPAELALKRAAAAKRVAKGKRRAPATTTKTDDTARPLTHTLSFRSEVMDFPIRADPKFKLELNIPVLQPTPPPSGPLGLELRRAHVPWPEETHAFLKRIRSEQKLTKSFALQ